MKLLLLSNGKRPGESLLAWAEDYLKGHLNGISRVDFVPFAAVTFGYDDYTADVRKALEALNISVTGLHESKDPQQTIKQSECIMIGGGNTFSLLKKLYDLELVEPLTQAVESGTPYIGWSAGANLAGPTIQTTNDMPIVVPRSFASFAWVPFQINPHYTEESLSKHGGETRIDRLKEFLAANPAAEIIGLPEGMAVSKVGNDYTLLGEGVAKYFRLGHPIESLMPGRLVLSTNKRAQD
jgi:dipeptidase E